MNAATKLIEAELRRIYDERGDLTPALVLEEARDPSNILHGQFEWDDGEAADRFRYLQAAGVIRSIKVRVTRQEASGEVNDYQVRTWQAARHAGDGGANPGSYLPVETIVQPGRTLLLQRMQRDLQAMRRRYAGLAEFWAQVDQLKKEGDNGDHGPASMAG